MDEVENGFCVLLQGDCRSKASYTQFHRLFTDRPVGSAVQEVIHLMNCNHRESFCEDVREAAEAVEEAIEELREAINRTNNGVLRGILGGQVTPGLLQKLETVDPHL
jgi:hypothetical protein